MLGTFRYDSLFDYSDKLDDSEAGDVVFEHFLRLHRDVNPLLVARNEKRLEKGHLTYPYFLPRWLPNGVQTWHSNALIRSDVTQWHTCS